MNRIQSRCHLKNQGLVIVVVRAVQSVYGTCMVHDTL